MSNEDISEETLLKRFQHFIEMGQPSTLTLEQTLQNSAKGKTRDEKLFSAKQAISLLPKSYWQKFGL